MKLNEMTPKDWAYMLEKVSVKSCGHKNLPADKKSFSHACLSYIGTKEDDIELFEASWGHDHSIIVEDARRAMKKRGYKKMCFEQIIRVSRWMVLKEFDPVSERSITASVRHLKRTKSNKFKHKIGHIFVRTLNCIGRLCHIQKFQEPLNKVELQNAKEAVIYDSLQGFGITHAEWFSQELGSAINEFVNKRDKKTKRTLKEQAEENFSEELQKKFAAHVKKSLASEEEISKKWIEVLQDCLSASNKDSSRTDTIFGLSSLYTQCVLLVRGLLEEELPRGHKIVLQNRLETNQVSIGGKQEYLDVKIQRPIDVFDSIALKDAVSKPLITITTELSCKIYLEDHRLKITDFSLKFN
ncbi:MAG: hypothetical protein P4L16_02670 [Chlamydiales bacterium]|nr:hypothetical protein [Chlamydiales bacterium]